MHPSAHAHIPTAPPPPAWQAPRRGGGGYVRSCRGRDGFIRHSRLLQRIECKRSLKKSKKRIKSLLLMHWTAMLLRFAVTNHLSIRSEAELVFIAAPLKEQRKELIASRYGKHGVLPVIALYGANASGKSNLLDAIAFMRRLVMHSFDKGDPSGGLRTMPFRLDETTVREPSKYLLDFVLRDIRYQYGFEITKERVVSEWLYGYPKQLRTVLFTRDSAHPEEFHFGRSLTGSNKQIQSITRPNALFLSAAATSGHILLKEISEYFSKKISMLFGSNHKDGESIAEALEEDKEIFDQTVRYLAIADVGISDIKIEREDFPEAARAELGEFLKLLSRLSDKGIPAMPEKHVEIKLGHRSGDGIVRYLDFSSESLGTRHLFSILLPMLKALRDGNILIIDEITTSLHTLLSRRLVSMFQDPSVNLNGAQLIFSTHDTNLLAPGFLRRDEIWFAEKGADGATSIFPLTDIKTKNTDNIERGYIQGRFGGVPYLSQMIS